MKLRLTFITAFLLLLPRLSGAQETAIPLPDGLYLQVQACRDDIFRIRISPRADFPQSLMERYGILKTDWEPLPVQTLSTDGEYVLSTRTHSVRVSLRDGKIRLLDAADKAVMGEISFSPSGSELSAGLAKAIHEKFGELSAPSAIIGDVESGLPETEKKAEEGLERNCVLSIGLLDGERFYGGGSTSREHIQHRGELLRMWATYQKTEIPMPFLMSSEGWGIYLNSTWKSYFDIGYTDKERLHIYNCFDEADFYLMAGDGMPAILNLYTLLTGRNYLLPKWAYGLCFGPNMKEDQWDILSDAMRFREADVPCDVFWLEPQWMSKHYDYSTQKKWNYDKFTPEYFWKENKYPKTYNPALFIGKLRTMGLHLGLWICENYDLSITEEDALPGAAPSGQEHWMDHLTTFIDMGAEGFKLDPARTLMNHTPFSYYNGRTDAEMHNLNQVLLPKQLAQVYRGHTGKRGWQHYCGGWSGTQHWGASTSGDNGGGKIALFDQLNLGNSGFMNTSCDVMFVPAGDEMKSLHFGTFLPWLQINSWCSMMQPFYFNAQEKEIYRNCIRLRYDLMPYIYSLAIEGSLCGLPMVRSMPLVFPEDRKVDDMWSQYMFGPSFCVGIFTNEIYLPAGEWTDAWTGEKIHSAGEYVHRDYPADRAGLLFIREGAIIPTAPAYDGIGLDPYTELTLKLFPHGDSSYTLYDCDAESYAYEQGEVASTRIDCSCSGKTVKLLIHPQEGRFERMPSSRSWTLEAALAGKPSKVLVNGKSVKEWTWDGKGTLRIGLPPYPVDKALEVVFQ